MTQSFWLSFLSHCWTLSVFLSALSFCLFYPCLSFIHLFLHRTVRAPCYGSFVAGHYWHAWVAALLWVYQWLLIIQMSCVRVRAVLPQQRGNAERMLHQCCGQDYLKNLLKLILHFMISAHSSPHMDGCIVLSEFEWSHICLGYLFFCWVKLVLLPWNHILIIQVESNLHHCCISLHTESLRRIPIASDLLLLT